MSNDLLQQSATYLKQAVQFMLKYKIPTTPSNYALWYAYVSGENSELNRELDQVIAEFQTCPPSSTEQLYRKYISDPGNDIKALKQDLDSMVSDLNASLKDSAEHAAEFQSNVDAQFGTLNGLDVESASLDQVLEMVTSLSQESDKIRANTSQFTDKIEQTQGEMREIKAQLQQPDTDSMFDSLTGVLNSDALEEDLSALLSQAPEGTNLILADIDHFKEFNDQYGRPLGDQVLKAVSKRLWELCRNGAKLYRLSGTGFAVVVPRGKPNECYQLAESMRQKIERLAITNKRKGTKIAKITASFGICQWQSPMTAAQLKSSAESAMAEAKQLGRNMVMPIS